MQKIFFLLLILASPSSFLLPQKTAKKNTCQELSRKYCLNDCIWLKKKKMCIQNPCVKYKDEESCDIQNDMCVWRPGSDECELKPKVNEKTIWKYKNGK